MGGLCSGNTCWKWQTKLSHEATCLDSCQMCLLLSKGNSCNRPRRPGGRKCKYKSVQECIVAASLSCLNLVVEHKREKGIPGLMDTTMNQQLGPKRASRIWKLFRLSKEDDAYQMLCWKALNKKGKPRTLLSHVSCNTNVEVLCWGNNVIVNNMRRLWNVLNV